MAKKKTKKNQPDATLRNVRASKKRDAKHDARIRGLGDRVGTLENLVDALWRKVQMPAAPPEPEGPRRRGSR